MRQMTNDNIDYEALTTMEDGEIPTSYVKSDRMYKTDEFYITVRLSDLQGATITSVENDEGVEERGLFLPFRESGLTVTSKKNVLLVCKAELAQVASKYTHVLTQVCGKDVWDERRRLGFKQSLVGHMRPSWFGKKKK